VRHDAIVEPSTGRGPTVEGDEPTAEERGVVAAAVDGPEVVVERAATRFATFDISFAVTTVVVVATAISAVLTPRGVPGAAWIEAAGASASVCCGLYLTAALGAGDGPEERRRAAGWMAFAGIALGSLLVLEFLREFFTAG
jgi:hypothetical protein